MTTVRIGDDPRGRPTAYEADVMRRPANWRSGKVARESPCCVRAMPTAADYWLAKQVQWQEMCDQTLREFDDQVAAHFPQHQPMNCTTCPVPVELPVRPEPPFERALSQS